jgi:hypothetical protein
MSYPTLDNLREWERAGDPTARLLLVSVRLLCDYSQFSYPTAKIVAGGLMPVAFRIERLT